MKVQKCQNPKKRAARGRPRKKTENYKTVDKQQATGNQIGAGRAREDLESGTGEAGNRMKTDKLTKIEGRTQA